MTPINDAVDAAKKSLGYRIRKPVLKAHGWSGFGKFMSCRKKYFYSYVDKADPIDSGDSSALEVGILVHAFLEIMYLKGDVEALKIAILNQDCDVVNVLEAWRIYEAYCEEYVVDYLIPKRVECWVHSEAIPFIGRIDLVAEIADPPPGLRPGLYIVDHKTTSRFDSVAREAWYHDGEILGQQMCWDSLWGSKFTPPLQGSIINLIGKQKKKPKFERIVIPIRPKRLDELKRDLLGAACGLGDARRTNEWPKNRSSCVTRYGKCRFYGECWGA